MLVVRVDGVRVAVSVDDDRVSIVELVGLAAVRVLEAEVTRPLTVAVVEAGLMPAVVVPASPLVVAAIIFVPSWVVPSTVVVSGATALVVLPPAPVLAAPGSAVLNTFLCVVAGKVCVLTPVGSNSGPPDDAPLLVTVTVIKGLEMSTRETPTRFPT